jgi:hypothetical protein
MDIHKPKPWHSLREFLREYLIIVIGVLTALAAEAVVQTLHEHRLSEEARASVRAEINLDLANMKRREEIEPCVARRLAELGDWVAKAEAGQPIPPPLTIGAPGHPVIYTERWEAATAGGRTSLLSLDEQRGFARIVEQFKGYQASKPVEREVWGALVGLEGVRHPSPELLARAREMLGRARLLDLNIQRVLYETKAFATNIGIKGDSDLFFAQSYKDLPICQPLGAPQPSATNSKAIPRPSL